MGLATCDRIFIKYFSYRVASTHRIGTSLLSEATKPLHGPMFTEPMHHSIYGYLPDITQDITYQNAFKNKSAANALIITQRRYTDIANRHNKQR